MPQKPVLVSGVKPTGTLHIGNYLGAVKNIIDLQNSGNYQVYVFIADFHALTGDVSTADLKENTKIIAAEFLAAGVDPKKTVFFRQSDVPQCTELAWVFSCVSPVGELERMTQYKDRALVKKQSVNGGLLFYPVLMAADILLYKCDTVPVGEDQIQHVELTRNIARWFNNQFGEYFPTTKHLLTEVPRVMSIIEPEKKMSKSLGAGHAIFLSDEPEVIEKKLKKAVTATQGGRDNPGVQNLLLLLKHFGAADKYQKFLAAEKDGTIRYGDLKSELAQALSGYFADFRQKRKDLLTDEAKLDEILAGGAARAREVAEKTMVEVRKLVGLR